VKNIIFGVICETAGVKIRRNFAADLEEIISVMIMKQYGMKLMVFTFSFMECVCAAAQQNQMTRRLTVDELFGLVEANSHALRTQKSGLDVAVQAVEAAKAQRLPDVDAQLSASYLGNGFTLDRHFGDFTKAPIPHFGNNFALEASQVIYSGGALTSGITLAELSRRQSELMVQQSREQLRFLSLEQYLELFKLENQVKVYQQNIALTERLIANVHAKEQQGTALKNDITRYELQLENLRLELVKVRNEQAVQNHQLCTTLGLPYETTIVPDTMVVNRLYAQDGEAFWQKNATDASPVLQQAGIQTEMARAQVKLARSEMLPKVSLIAADHFDGPITIEVPPINRNFNYWYVGIGVKYSLSSLFKSNRKLQQAQWSARQSEENRTTVADQLENAVQADYIHYRQSYDEWHTQQKSVELARQNYRVINDRYLNQLALVTDMVDAANIKLSAELQEVNARIGIVYAYYKMKYTAGNL
jgi:outer membrane protein